jgi:uncharacterized membrane protein
MSSAIAAVLVRHEGRIALGLTVAWTLLYATLAVLRHVSWHSTAFDLAVFDQVYWNTLHGRILESTLDRGVCEPTSFFGGHLSLIHFALLPFYAVVPRAETLVVLQTIAIGIGVWPIHLIAREVLRPGAERLAWVVAYLLAAVLSWMALFDFHSVPFAIAPLGFALLFLVRRRYWSAVGALVASFVVKEELPLVALGFVAYLLLVRAWAPAAALLAASIAWFVLAVQVVIPAFAGGEYRYTSFYASLGANEAEIVRTVVTDPARTLAVLFNDGRVKLRYLFAIFGPGLGLVLGSFRYAVVVLPTLAYSLLSDYSHQYSLQTHYPAVLIPLAMGTSAIGMSRLRGRLRAVAPGAVVAASLGLAFLYGDVPVGPKFDPTRFTRDPRYDAIASELAAIPADAHVSASDFIAAQLAQRRFLYEYSYQQTCGKADVVILDVADRESFRGDRGNFAREVDVLRLAGYEETARGDGLRVLWRRR